MRLLSLWLMLYTSYTWAQVNPGARVTALGGSGAALEDIYSLGGNQAGIARIQKTTIGMVYVEHYLGTDISSQAGFLATPTKIGAFGFALHRFGLSEGYTELKASGTYAKAFGPALAMGISAHYHQLAIPSYGSNHTFSVDFGMQYRIHERITSAFHVSNVGRFTYENTLYAHVPTIFTVGSMITFSEQVLLCADLVYPWLGTVDGRFGLEYSLAHWLNLRGGISLEGFQQYMGFGFQHRDLRLDAAASIHRTLGLSPQIAVSYEF